MAGWRGFIIFMLFMGPCFMPGFMFMPPIIMGFMGPGMFMLFPID